MAHKVINKAKRKIGGKKTGVDDEDYQQNVTRFKDLDRKVKGVEESLKKYEKAIGVIPQTLEKLVAAITEFYNEDEYTKYAQEFTKSSHIVEEAIKDFQSEQANIRHELDDYLARVATVKKNIQLDQELFTSMKEKEKAAEKGGKNASALTEKYQAAKESYEAKHEEVARELAELLENKYSDFENKFKAIVQAQRNLFAKMSNSFDIDILGIASGISSLKMRKDEEEDSAEGNNDNAEKYHHQAYSAPPKIEEPTPQFNPNVPPRTIRPVASPINYGDSPQPPPRTASPIPSSVPRTSGTMAGGSSLVPVQASVPLGSLGPPPSSYQPQVQINTYHTPDGKLAIVPTNERGSYEELFMRQTQGGKLSGVNAIEMWAQSGLSNEHLAIIWEVSDQDKDGHLTMEEFVLAMYLINAKRRGIITDIPHIPPPEYTIRPASRPIPTPTQQMPGSFFPPPPTTHGRHHN
jgi:tetratricopeptide (TPR) repeat protein